MSFERELIITCDHSDEILAEHSYEIMPMVNTLRCIDRKYAQGLLRTMKKKLSPAGKPEQLAIMKDKQILESYIIAVNW